LILTIEVAGNAVCRDHANICVAPRVLDVPIAHENDKELKPQVYPYVLANKIMDDAGVTTRRLERSRTSCWNAIPTLRRSAFEDSSYRDIDSTLAFITQI